VAGGNIGENVQELGKLWWCAKEKLTNEEIKNKLLFATNDGRNYAETMGVG